MILHGVLNYSEPSVEFVGIDPASRTITERVVPAVGTRIVTMPLKRAFDFCRICADDDGGASERRRLGTPD